MAGFTPAQVDQMSLWEFSCVMAGLAEMHGGKSGTAGGEPPFTDEELRNMGIVGF